MPGFNSDSTENQDSFFNADACYEIIASQEEIYLEEVEEDLRAILLFDKPSDVEEVDEPLSSAVDELVTGDSDDPPLSDDMIVEMLRIAPIKNA